MPNTKPIGKMKLATLEEGRLQVIPNFPSVSTWIEGELMAELSSSSYYPFLEFKALGATHYELG